MKQMNEKMIEKVQLDGKFIALIMYGGPVSEGINFITPDDNPLQVGVLNHKSGTVIRPHRHKTSKIEIRSIQEMLYIEKGRVQVDLYNDEGTKSVTKTLSAGDMILLMAGGHGLNIIEDANIIEVKQGPYRGIKEDKEFL